MATDIKWPLGLHTIQKSSKARNQLATFQLADPRSGPPYRKRLSDDVPVIWDVSFIFGGDDATIFWSWFENAIDRGRTNFILPIATEFGTVDHEVMFLPDSLLPVSEAGPVFTYTAQILARKLVIPDEYPDDIWVDPDIWKYRSILDPAVNWYWPNNP
ncbi:hypothetical protein OUL81_000481 [Salmonella enterica]|uniref:Uncharacterized protein n=1 Tax=Salmonella enterica TaxID=28901 RepID=A0A747KC73_SALER|nr:hypothetical protein [Salmonella enterica subsp. enterica serovar Ank]EKE2788441.1 hypothetical protein [Salmonella enterica]EBH2789590.1 hypothetical protein [Salmonella enterica subsp. enterica serovar Ank]EFX3898363.1 hypothetical protein [Salmonella enterica subsp. enterica serovar Ank]EHY9925889.1 hypothetical protein [Salmonella enterica subsp. enterica serovar Ank]